MLLTVARASGVKDECQVQLTGIEREYWMCTEISRLEVYVFQGTVTAGDGFDQKGGKLGSYVNLQGKGKSAEEGWTRRFLEGSNSNSPELAAFVLALRGTPVKKTMLYLFEALLKAAVKGWIGTVGRRKSDVSRSARRRHFTGSNRRAPKKNNSRSSDVSGQGESASNRICK